MSDDMMATTGVQYGVRPVEITVIHWRYYDGSDSGIVGAWETRDEAIRALNLLKEHGDTKRQFLLWPSL